MAKKQKAKVFSFQGFDIAHYKTTSAYTRVVSALFDKATSDIAAVVSRENYNPDKPFSFDDYPKARAYLQTVLKGLAKKTQAVIETGARRQWLFACQKNDEFLASIIDTTKLTKARLKKMQDRNLDAMQAFQERKVGGMNLSERVWKYTKQYKEQIEVGLDVGLGEGRSAQQLSRDLRQNLNDPDRLFRRVRDKRGNLQLSKAARAFHPGTGVYRSSYKNAMRLTRSEINMAYRESDYLRWQQLDFVVGFEVHRSNHEPQCKCKLCERLTGKYPKWFKFKGWHPQCMCYATAILVDEETFNDQELSDFKSALRGTEYKKLSSKNEVTDLPDGFKEWVKENTERQAGWKSTPYFIKDNFVGGDLAKGLRYAGNDIPLTTIQKAELRHRQRTPEQIESIRRRWGDSRAAVWREETLDDLKLRLGELLPKTLSNLDGAINRFEKTENYGKIAKEHKEEIETLMRDVFKKHDFGMNIEEGVLGKVLNSWFKNTFEVGGGNGYVGSTKTTGKIEVSHHRLSTAHQLFGMPSNNLTKNQLKRSEYEKYGHLLDHDIRNSLRNNPAEWYGKVEVRFKKNKVLTTWTAGDSLRGEWQPSLCSDPKSCSFDDYSRTPKTKNIDVSDLAKFRSGHICGYIELQYHGKLTVDCVESLAYPYDLTSPNNANEYNIATRWKNAGVKVYYIGEDGELRQL